MSNLRDLTGQHFGRLTVTRRGEDRISLSGRRYVRWVCMCECGNETIVDSQNLIRGNVKSCGCLLGEYNKKSYTDMTGWIMREHGVKDSKVTVIDFYGYGSNGAEWNCLCECGNTFVANGRYLRQGKTRSCGCILNPKIINMSGWDMKDHGVPDSRIKIIEYTGTNSDNKSLWKCKCSCGKIFVSTGKDIRNGHTKSCGCLQKELSKMAVTTHGESKKRLYRIYAKMKNRCYDSNCKSYKTYGACGIKVCDEWLNSYEVFRDWAMQNGYSDELTIDRIDSNGDYEPKNCRWATWETQANNTKRNHILTYGGCSKTMAQWAKDVNIPYTTLRHRINSLKWSDEKAITTPVRNIKRMKRYV